MRLERVYEKIVKIANNNTDYPEYEEKIQALKNICKTTPFRIKIILFAFAHNAEGDKVEKLNETLRKNNEEVLYERNLLDATTCFALRRGLSFEEWLGLNLNNKEEKKKQSKDKDFHITLEELEKYEASFVYRTEGESALTRSYTNQIRNYLESINAKETTDYIKDYMKFIEENSKTFIENRERALRKFIEYFIMYAKHAKENPVVDVITNKPSTPLFEQDLSTIKITVFLEELYSYYGIVDQYDEMERFNSTFDRNVKNYMRDIFKGKVDITRNFFILSIVYMSSYVEASIEINLLNKLLRKCNYAPINENNPTGLDKYIVPSLGYSKDDVDCYFDNIDKKFYEYVAQSLWVKNTIEYYFRYAIDRGRDSGKK